MMRHYPDLGSASDMVVPCAKFASTNQKHYPDLASSIHGETIGRVAKCRLFSQATLNVGW